EVAETFFAHDVPDRHVHVDLRAVRGAELHLPLGDFRAQGRDVAVVELVLDEPSDQGRLADRGLADEADFRLDSLGLGHGGIVPFVSDYLKGPPGGHPGGTFLSEPLFGTAMRLERRLILALDLVDTGAAITVTLVVYRIVVVTTVRLLSFLTCVCLTTLT